MVQPAEIQLSNRRFASDNLPERNLGITWGVAEVGCKESWMQWFPFLPSWQIPVSVGPMKSII